nr:unnamed protein product [Spirometra erinaceieuropaei]
MTSSCVIRRSHEYAIAPFPIDHKLLFCDLCLCSLRGTYSFSLTSSCGCDVQFILPYLRCDPIGDPAEIIADPSAKSAPTWMEVKIRRPLRLRGLLVCLVCAQILAFSLSRWLSFAKSPPLIVLLSVATVWLWAWSSVSEVSVLASRSLGVQCACRYLSGRRKHLPLITPEEIRGIHLIDRVTNVSVRTFLALEICTHDPAPLSENKFSNSHLSSAFSLRPLFQLAAHPDAPVCCLSLDCLVAIYRLSFAVLFDRNYQVFHSSAHTPSLNQRS